MIFHLRNNTIKAKKKLSNYLYTILNPPFEQNPDIWEDICNLFTFLNISLYLLQIREKEQ